MEAAAAASSDFSRIDVEHQRVDGIARAVCRVPSRDKHFIWWPYVFLEVESQIQFDNNNK